MDEKNFDEDKIKIFDKNNGENDSLPNKENSFEEEESVTIQGKNVIKISSRSQERLFNIIDSTAEEEGNFTWKPEEKEVENHLFSSSEKQMSPAEENLAKTQRKEIPSRSRSRATKRINKNKIQKKYPIHYYIVFYTVPIIIILILLLLVIKKYNDVNSSTIVGEKQQTNEQKIWDSSKSLAHKGYLEKLKGESYNRKDRKEALRRYTNAKKLYESAIKKGNYVLNIQVEIEMSEKGITREQAIIYVNKDFAYYKEKINDWEKETKSILELINQIKK